MEEGAKDEHGEAFSSSRSVIVHRSRKTVDLCNMGKGLLQPSSAGLRVLIGSDAGWHAPKHTALI